MKNLSKTLRAEYLEKYKEKINNLSEYFLPSPFSSKSFPFYPTKKDWKIIRKYIPTILIYLTNRCNTFCKICFTNSSPFDSSKEISKKNIINILKKIGRKKRVVLIGGEPTIRDDLFEIIEIIKKSGNQPELYTNGLRLSSFNYTKKLKELGVKRIYFSFDGFSKEIYKKMNNDDKIMLFKLLALRNLEILGIDTIISARIAKGLNEDQIRNLIELCVASAKKHGCVKGIYFYGATPYGRFLIEDSKISSLELVRLVEEATNHEIDIEYLVETKKLALQIFKTFSRFGIHPPFGSGGIMGLYKAGSIKKLLPTKFIKRITEYLKKGKVLTVIYESLKNKEIRRILLRFIFEKDLLGAIARNGIFIVGIGNVNTPLNHQSYLFDCIGFERGGKRGVPLVNLSSYSGNPEPK